MINVFFIYITHSYLQNIAKDKAYLNNIEIRNMIKNLTINILQEKVLILNELSSLHNTEDEMSNDYVFSNDSLSYNKNLLSYLNKMMLINLRFTSGEKWTIKNIFKEYSFEGLSFSESFKRYYFSFAIISKFFYIQFDNYFINYNLGFIFILLLGSAVFFINIFVQIYLKKFKKKSEKLVFTTCMLAFLLHTNFLKDNVIFMQIMANIGIVSELFLTFDYFLMIMFSYFLKYLSIIYFLLLDSIL